MSLLTVGRSSRANVLVGLFASAAFLMLGIWITVKLLGQTLLRNQYHAFATDVTGLREGTPILVAGYRIGVVTDIAYRWTPPPAVDTGNPRQMSCLFLNSPASPTEMQPVFKLDLAIEKEWPVNEGSEVTLQTPSLLGQPILALRSGNGAPLCAGSAIPFQSMPSGPGTPDLTELINHAKRVLAAVETLLKQVDAVGLSSRAGDLLARTQETVNRLGNTADAVSDFVKDSSMQNIKTKTEHAAIKFDKVLDETELLMRDLRAAAPMLRNGFNELQPPLSRAATKLELTLRLTATRLPAILSALERSAQDLSGILADFRNSPSATLRGRNNLPP